LVVRGIRCKYDSAEVLRDVDFAIERGELLGILGPNGSGKTTLLRCLARTLKPHAGAILIDGKDIYELPPRRVARDVALVPQETGISLDFTAAEIVLMGRNPHLGRFQFGDSHDFEVVRGAMETADVLRFADRPVTQLSSGERQRVIIARALAQEPSLLLLDEPTAHLDPNNQLEIMDLLAGLNEERGLTIIAVLHDLNLAARYCDSAILLKEGRIADVGPIARVLTPKKIEHIFRVKVSRIRVDGITQFVPLKAVEGP